MLKGILAFTGLTKKPPLPTLPSPAIPAAPKARRQVRVAPPGNGTTPAPKQDGWSKEEARRGLAMAHRRDEPFHVSTAVRWIAYEALPHADRKAVSKDGFARTDPRATARAALGVERLSYLRMLLLLRLPLPTMAKTLEGVEPHETGYRQRLDVSVLEDIKTWRSGLAIHDALVAAAEIDLTTPPEPVSIPAEVEKAMAAQAAEELARMRRGSRGQGSGSAVTGGETTTADKTEPPADEPPAGPKAK